MQVGKKTNRTEKKKFDQAWMTRRTVGKRVQSRPSLLRGLKYPKPLIEP